MGFWGDAACTVGLHKWQGWSYEKQNDCKQVQKCSRCSAVHKATQVVHLLGEWYYPEERNCTFVRKCQRCSHQESKLEHCWLPWAYLLDGSCEQERSCGRCPEKETRQAHSKWTEWSYNKADSCIMTRECERCKEPQEILEHVWGVWVYEGPKSCEQIRFCQRCQEREERYPMADGDHEAWSEWDYKNAFNCSVFEQHCLRCGKEKTDMRLPLHQWGEWRMVSADRAERRCRRCPESQTRYVELER